MPGRRVKATTILHPPGGEPVRFEAGDEVPEDLQPLITNPEVWDDEPDA